MSIRQEKISSLLKRELAIIFQRESKNLFQGAFITVTIVRIAPDLSVGKVYLSLFQVKEKDALLKHVNEQEWQIKKLLTAALGKNLRKIPSLRFYEDDSLDYAEQIDSLLK